MKIAIRYFQLLYSAGPLALISVTLTGVLIVICIVALTGGSLRMKERIATAPPSLEEREQVMENVIITRTKPDIQLDYMIESARLIQYPERGVTEFESPKYTEFHHNGFTRMIVANHGILTEDTNILELTGELEITEKDTPDQIEGRTMNSVNLVINLN